MEEPVKFSIYQGMKSGFAEQAALKYKKIVGKESIWYVALQSNQADNIYVTSKSGPTKFGSFEGFGGATLLFELEDGTVDSVKGPWHSNSGALLADTGYDITKLTLTRGLVAKKKEFTENWKEEEYSGILHYDEEPILGTYTRILDIAQDFANQLGQDIWYAMVSKGGGTSGCKHPIKENG